MSEEIKLIEKPEDIHLNESQDIQQILGDPPGWILKWGISLVFLFVSVLMTLSYLIKYPDVVIASMELTTENPPIRVVTRTSGKVSELLVKAREEVTEGDLLAIIENPANAEDVKALESFLEPLSNSITLSGLLRLRLPSDWNLGTLQGSYSQFSQGLEELRYLSRKSGVAKKIKALEEQINQLKSLNESLEKQKSTLRKVVSLAAQNLDRNKELLNKRVGSVLDVENAESAFLQSKQELESMDAQMINNKVRIEQLLLEIIQTEQGRKDEKFPKYFVVQEDLQRLKSELKNWQQAYLIYAPISGIVEMNQVWSANQFLNASAELLTIVPENASNTIKSMGFLPFEGSGKVKIGMAANLRFDAFPFQEFGAIKSKVKSISEVPQEGGYLIELEIADPLITTYGKTIPFRQEMKGSVNIITEDRRILDRIFDKVMSAIKNRNSAD